MLPSLENLKLSTQNKPTEGLYLAGSSPENGQEVSRKQAEQVDADLLNAYYNQPGKSFEEEEFLRFIASKVSVQQTMGADALTLLPNYEPSDYWRLYLTDVHFMTLIDCIASQYLSAQSPEARTDFWNRVYMSNGIFIRNADESYMVPDNAGIILAALSSASNGTDMPSFHGAYMSDELWTNRAFMLEAVTRCASLFTYGRHTKKVWRALTNSDMEGGSTELQRSYPWEQNHTNLKLVAKDNLLRNKIYPLSSEDLSYADATNELDPALYYGTRGFDVEFESDAPTDRVLFGDQNESAGNRKRSLRDPLEVNPFYTDKDFIREVAARNGEIILWINDQLFTQEEWEQLFVTCVAVSPDLLVVLQDGGKVIYHERYLYDDRERQDASVSGVRFWPTTSASRYYVNEFAKRMDIPSPMPSHDNQKSGITSKLFARMTSLRFSRVNDDGSHTAAYRDFGPRNYGFFANDVKVDSRTWQLLMRILKQPNMATGEWTRRQPDLVEDEVNPAWGRRRRARSSQAIRGVINRNRVPVTIQIMAAYLISRITLPKSEKFLKEDDESVRPLVDIHGSYLAHASKRLQKMASLRILAAKTDLWAATTVLEDMKLDLQSHDNKEKRLDWMKTVVKVAVRIPFGQLLFRKRDGFYISDGKIGDGRIGEMDVNDMTMAGILETYISAAEGLEKYWRDIRFRGWDISDEIRSRIRTIERQIIELEKEPVEYIMDDAGERRIRRLTKQEAEARHNLLTTQIAIRRKKAHLPALAEWEVAAHRKIEALAFDVIEMASNPHAEEIEGKIVVRSELVRRQIDALMKDAKDAIDEEEDIAGFIIALVKKTEYEIAELVKDNTETISKEMVKQIAVLVDNAKKKIAELTNQPGGAAKRLNDRLENAKRKLDQSFGAAKRLQTTLGTTNALMSAPCEHTHWTLEL